VILHTSTINDNDTGLGNGGGIYHAAGDLSLEHCTVSGNSSGNSGGGIYAADSLLLHFSTVAKNRADSDTDGSGDAGGIYAASGPAQVRNSIIGDNDDWFPQVPDCSGTLTSQGYNLVEDTAGCTIASTTGDLFGFLPNLGPLADNGGPTWTHALIGGSVAIEHIPDGAYGCNAGSTRDQRGCLRGGGAGHGGSLCDIGACEYDSEPFRVFFPLVLR
jgi:predicted outer membrane repeat protein